MDKLIELQRGEYAIPDNCRAMVHDNKVYIFERLGRGRKKKKEHHCKDCAHRQKGQTDLFRHTFICTQRPKYNTRGTKGLYYAANESGTICSKFKPL